VDDMWGHRVHALVNAFFLPCPCLVNGAAAFDGDGQRLRPPYAALRLPARSGRRYAPAGAQHAHQRTRERAGERPWRTVAMDEDEIVAPVEKRRGMEGGWIPGGGGDLWWRWNGVRRSGSPEFKRGPATAMVAKGGNESSSSSEE
jgi:hypothetical protein